jgi:putative DNA primase/helicase
MTEAWAVVDEQEERVVRFASENGRRPRPVLDSPLAERPYRLYSARELDDLPPAEWLIDQAVPRNAIVGAIGAKGALKTFTILDLACHVASGLAWHGRKVKPGAVVYVYAEGPFGAKARIDAWCAHYAKASDLPLNRGELSLYLLPTRIPINSPSAVAALILEISRKEIDPVLIVIDTLNQNLDGDEDGRGMGGFAAGCSFLRDRYGATVLVVHHTPLGAEDRGRGHTAFDGVLDTRFIISRDADRVTLDCTHQRNAEDGWSVSYEAIPVGNSLALQPSSPSGGYLKGKRRELLDLAADKGPSSYTPLLKDSGMNSSTFKKSLKWLSDSGYVEKSGAKYVVTTAGSIALGLPGSPEGYL